MKKYTNSFLVFLLSIAFPLGGWLVYKNNTKMGGFKRKTLINLQNPVDSLKIPANFTPSKLRKINNNLFAVQALDSGWIFFYPKKEKNISKLYMLFSSDSLDYYRKYLNKYPNHYTEKNFQDISYENVLLKYDNISKRNIIVSLDSNNIIIRKNDIFENRKDFLALSEYGKILQVKDNIYYVCNFVNKIYLMNSSLEILKKANTIDTFKSYPKVIENKEMYRFITPPQMVNAQSFVKSERIYINSYANAENENLENKRVIDVYDSFNIQYKGSIYVPLSKRESITDFAIEEDKLYVVTEKNIYVYIINKEF